MHSVEKKIYLGILVCVLISIVGVSFAFFTSGVDINGSGGKVDVNTSDLIHVAYDAGDSSIVLENAIPGTDSAHKSKIFTVTITPTENQKSVKYAIQLIINETDKPFTKCTSKTDDNNCEINAEELIYTLKEGNDVIKTGDLLELNVGNNTLAEISKTVDVSKPFTYSLEILYSDTGFDQNHNMNKIFSANVKVVLAK